MFFSNTSLSTQDVFQEKSDKVYDLYDHLLGELKRIGPIGVSKKALSISFSSDHQRAFAWVILRNRSIKLVFRTHHKVASQRIVHINRVSTKFFDHTMLVESKNDIDTELMKWLGEAYMDATPG